MASVASVGAPGRTVGRYALFEEIASGGMATVHLGRLVGPVGFSRTVAIKRLHPQFAKDTDFVAMFLDEARLVARIRHPNVVPTLDVVQEESELLLVMEYVQGETLSRLLRRSRALNQRPPVPVVATVLVGVLHGLHAAHEATGESGEPLMIVHRDVSPQNILVGPDGVPRLLDFGVAKATQRLQSTRDGQVKGKLAYMAPEQVSSDDVDRRCDVFAAGVVLWEALAGKRLFEGQTDARIMQQILHADIPPPSLVAPEVSPELDAICARALSRDRAGRFTTAREMALALEKATPLATASDAGAWVELLAHEVIAERAARVAEIESRSDVFIKPAPAEIDVAFPDEPPPGATPTRRSRAIALTALALVLLGVAVSAGFALATLRQERPAPAAAAAAPASGSAPAPAPSPPLAPASAPPAASQVAAPTPPVEDTPPSASPAPAKLAKPPARPPNAPSTKPRNADCSQPFAIDANGIKHVKPECL
jgi:serine/threonine-protein kinase